MSANGDASALDEVRHTVRSCGPDAERERILAFLDEHPDALDRSCAAGHLTGSALVVDPGRDAALLMHHRKLRRWLQMGGHADGESDLAAVALREAAEESGIHGLSLAGDGRAVDLDVHEVRPPDEMPHVHLDIRYVALAPAGSVASGNMESRAMRWVALDELAGFEEAGMRRLAAAARSLTA